MGLIMAGRHGQAPLYDIWMMSLVIMAVQTEHKWKLEGIEAAAAETLRARLKEPPRLR